MAALVEYPGISSEVVGSVMNVILDRPRALNAHSLEMLTELEQIVARADSDPRIKRIVISSTRKRVFCAGGDIKAVSNYAVEGQFDLIRDYFQTNKRVLLALRRTSIEVVSLIDGICYGGGFGICMASDVRVATPRSTFAMPEARIGFYPDVGATYFLGRLPNSLGRKLGCEAYTLSGDAAARSGVVDLLIDSSAIDSVALQLLADEPMERIQAHLESAETLLDSQAEEPPTPAEELCPTSIAIAEYLLQWGQKRSVEECLEYEAEISFRMAIRDDFTSGVTAVLGKGGNASWSPARANPLELESILSEHPGRIFDRDRNSKDARPATTSQSYLENPSSAHGRT